MSNELCGIFEESTEPAPQSKANDWVSHFFLKPDTKCSIVFLCNPQDFVKLKLHEVWAKDGDKTLPNHLSCVQTDEVDCPICKAAEIQEDDRDKNKLRRREFWCGSVLQLNAYEKDGKSYHQRKVLALNFTARKKFLTTLNTFEERGLAELKGCQYKVARSDDQKSLRTGDIWEFWKDDVLSGLPSDVIVEEYDIKEIYTPDIDLCLEVLSRSDYDVEADGTEESTFLPQ